MIFPGSFSEAMYYCTEAMYYCTEAMFYYCTWCSARQRGHKQRKWWGRREDVVEILSIDVNMPVCMYVCMEAFAPSPMSSKSAWKNRPSGCIVSNHMRRRVLYGIVPIWRLSRATVYIGTCDDRFRC